MINKIAKDLSLDRTPEVDSFAAGIGAFIKKAQLDKEEANDFLKHAAEVKLASAKREVFELGVLKFAADANLDEAETAAFITACSKLAQ